MSENPTIIVADDDPGIRTVLRRALERAGYGVLLAGDAAALWRFVADGEGDLVITDAVMPDANGLELIPQIRAARPELRVIAISARSTLMTALKAAEKGAFEYLAKPFDIDELVCVVGRALENRDSQAEVVPDADTAEEPTILIGRSPAMQAVYRTLARLVDTDLTVLIEGESGTGKELVARVLHDFGKRRGKPFVAINMAAIPRDLIESELFGHERGAFTGATQRASGRFQQADGGTLFLDEIGDMPTDAQTRLLRVLQTGEYTTVGGRAPIRADVRIIAATHRDLGRAIERGLFRDDLFFRLNVVPLRVPPLRERPEDLPDLVRHFLARAAAEGLSRKTLDESAIERLKEHPWPGNVRELENLVRRLAALYSQDVFGRDVIDAALADRPAHAQPGGNGLSHSVEQHLRAYFSAHGTALPAAGLYARILREVERPLISLCLEATRGNQIKASRVLGLNRNTLRKKIRDLEIPLVRGAR